MGESGEGAKTEISSLEQKIIQQIEYYFGDLNFPRDKFLQEEIKKDNGWVTFETLCKFNRLKNLSMDIDVLSAAMRKSKNGIIEVEADGKKVRRLKALPENSLEYWQEVKARTVYVKRFPDTITLDELLEFFKQQGNPEKVQMRFYKSDDQRNFKGSVFVTFPTRDEAKKFVNLESVKYGEEELVRLLQEQYFKAKSEESKRRKKEKKVGSNGTQGDSEKQEEMAFTSGRVLHLTGIPKEGVSLDDIKGLFKDQQNPEWVEFTRGEQEAFVRFEPKANSAEEVLKRALESKEGKLMLGESEIKAEVATGELEEKYWERTRKAIYDARNQKSAGRGRRGGKRGRGGRQGGRGGRQQVQNTKKHFSSSSESDAEEKAKTELKNTNKRAAEPGASEDSSAKKQKVAVEEKGEKI